MLSLGMAACSSCGVPLDIEWSVLTLEGFEGLCECFFKRQPGLARGENREDGDAVVGHEESDKEGLAESDDAHSRMVQGECLAA